MPRNLCSVRVVLLGHPKKSDGRHEGGHKRKGNWGNLSEDWQLSVDHIKQGNQQMSNCDYPHGPICKQIFTARFLAASA